MQVERLIARIRGQLELGTPDLEARSLAGEYAGLCQRARERLEQCAALARAGNEHAAFQAAETEPDLLGFCAALSFAESDRWHVLCRERGLPAGFPLDSQHVLVVENLYGHAIGENHPLYRDYRDAIRSRDEDRALSVLRSIVRINPDDPNARSELTRLSAKFLREALGKVGQLFATEATEGAVELMERMERFGALELADEPRWEAALARRAAWLRAKAAEQVAEHLRAAVEAEAGDHWEPCAAALGRVRALERDHHLNLAAEQLAVLGELEAWAGGLAAEAEAEASLRAAVVGLEEEWALLRQDAARGSPPAILIVRLNGWLERAAAQAERLPEGNIAEARALRRNTRARLSRRYLVLTSAWVVGLLVVVGGLVSWNFIRQQEEETLGRFSEANRLLELHDHPGAVAAVEAFENGGVSVAEKDKRIAVARPLRERLREQLATEQRLTLEALQLAERARAGPSPGTLGDTRDRVKHYLAELARVGPALREKLAKQFPSPEALAAACQAETDRLRRELETQTALLNKAIGEGASVADSVAAVAALDRLRASVRPLAEIREKDLDSAAAAADRGELRLGDERKVAAALSALAQAADLSAYLAALSDAAANLAGDKSDLGARASFVFGKAPTLQALPRSALAPRVGAMWDAAAAADPLGVFHPKKLNDEEQARLARLSDTSLVETLRRGSLQLYSFRGTTTGRPVFVLGDITETRATISDGAQFVQKARQLSQDGAVTEGTWRRQEFNNGVRGGEEVTGLTAIPELDYIRQITRFQDPQSGQLLEPPLRTMERIRRSDSPYPELRAYQLQEFFRLASIRPDAFGLLFSPSAQRDAEQLRRITQNDLRPYDFLFKDKWAHFKDDLRAFLIRQGGPGYAEEARFWRATFGELRSRKLIFAGMVGRDGRPGLRETVKGSVLYGLDNEGKATVLFRVTQSGEISRVADAAPLTPLLRYPGSVAEAAAATGIPAGLLPPEGGWETILQGRDL